MNSQKENLIVIRDETNKIIAIVSKNGQCTEIYECSMTGFDEIADLLTKITNK